MNKIVGIFFLFFLLIKLNLYAQTSLSDSNNEFAFKIYNTTKTDFNNFLISPFSLNIAFSIAKEGAGSTTFTEMEKLLSQENQKNINEQFDYFITTLTNNNNLQIANSIWFHENFKINKDYKTLVKDSYHSELFNFNSNNLKSANNQLNKWISESTNNKINKIAGLGKDSKVSIINAIYFMGEWEAPFNEKLTEEKKFFSIAKNEVLKDFMNRNTTLKYYEDSTLKCVYLPYKDQFSMLIFLPIENYGIAKMEEILSTEYLEKIESNSEKFYTILSLPKFKIESEIHPIENIIRLGCSEMFSNNADFSKMSTEENLQIGTVVHKTFIEIDEKKTEAAALSEIIMVGYAKMRDTPPPPPKVFNADHPFVFLIKDNWTNSILFMGRLVE